MIHFTCDCCKRPIETVDEFRYIVRLEVYASLDPAEQELDGDRDHLEEVHDILEQLDDAESDQISGDVYHQARFDLCSECRKRFVKNPLGRAMSHELNFSQN